MMTVNFANRNNFVFAAHKYFLKDWKMLIWYKILMFHFQSPTWAFDRRAKG